MPDSFQSRYTSSGAGAAGGSLLARGVAFIVGLFVLAVSVFLGAVFLAAIVGFMLIAGSIVMVRLWWARRKMKAWEQTHGDLDAEYTVVQSERIEVKESKD